MTPRHRRSDEFNTKLASVRCLTLDVDGVLTDGKLYMLPDGKECVAFDIQDGLGLVQLQRAGIHAAAISGRDNGAVRARLEYLNFRHIYLGVADKARALMDLMQSTGLSADSIAHMGDDLPDMPILDLVGVRIAVPNAMPAVLERADYITFRKGGHGAVREVCEMLLEARRGIGH